MHNVKLQVDRKECHATTLPINNFVAKQMSLKNKVNYILKSEYDKWHFLVLHKSFKLYYGMCSSTLSFYCSIPKILVFP